MAKFAFFFSYSSESWKKMLSNPGDRTAAVRSLAAAVGGSLESYYFMFGDRDGFATVEVPDSASAAGIAIAVVSSGAFDHFETHELIDPADLPAVLEKANAAVGSYTPPGG